AHCTSSLKRMVTCALRGTTVLWLNPGSVPVFAAPSATNCALGCWVKVMIWVSPNCIGSDPDRAATVEPVVALDQMPDARCLGRVKAEVAREVAMLASFRSAAQQLLRERCVVAVGGGEVPAF